MATNATVAITNAATGKTGYKGTLNGLSKSGSFRRNTSKETIETMYKVSAPKQAMVMISPVGSDSTCESHKL